jgi:FkbM family methyltransferase
MIKNKTTIFEIGVGSPNLCRTIEYMGNENYELFLFEANPSIYKELKNNFGKYNNVWIENIAMFDRDGELILRDDKDSSFIDTVKSPTAHNVPNIAKNIPQVIVPCASLKKYDKGNINIILIDTEGCEWIILKEIISRPELIILETHNNDDHGNGVYKTPNLDLIEKWMLENNYQTFKTDISDTWYKKNNNIII